MRLPLRQNRPCCLFAFRGRGHAPQPQSRAPKALGLRSAVHRKNTHPAARRTLGSDGMAAIHPTQPFTAAPISDCCGEAMPLV